MKTAETNLRIDADRLWSSLMELGQIGGTEKGGVCRIALTDLDRIGRDLFVRWAKEAGCTIKVDQLGNIFARREGKDPSKPPVMTGSHLDTQPTGGKFDGAYGVMAGLEVLRVLHDSSYVTEAPIEVAVWTNEEGCRFAPAMVASGVFGGAFELDYALGIKDRDGVTFGEALKKIGYDGKEKVGGRKIGAFFEAHIEQGPILEREKKTIGVVTGAQGQRWYEISWTGMESHAGTTPMEGRRDALVGAAELIVECRRIGNRPNGRSTIGVIESQPQSRNTIPGRVFMTVDFRHPDDGELTKMDTEMRSGGGRHRQASSPRGEDRADLVLPAVALRQGTGRGGAARGRARGLSAHGYRERRGPRRLLRDRGLRRRRWCSCPARTASATTRSRMPRRSTSAPAARSSCRRWSNARMPELS